MVKNAQTVAATAREASRLEASRTQRAVARTTTIRDGHIIQNEQQLYRWRLHSHNYVYVPRCESPGRKIALSGGADYPGAVWVLNPQRMKTPIMVKLV